MLYAEGTMGYRIEKFKGSVTLPIHEVIRIQNGDLMESLLRSYAFAHGRLF